MLKKSGLAPVNRGPVPPDITELHQVLSQALERRGQPVSTVWSSVDKLTTFTLTTIFNFKGGDPQWTLVSEYRGIKTPMFDYSTCDVLLVNNLMASACAELASLGRIQSGIGNPLKRDDATLRITDPVQKVGNTTEPGMRAASATESGQKSANFSDSAQKTGNASEPAQPTISSMDFVHKVPQKSEPKVKVPTEGELSRWPLDDLLKLITAVKATGKLEVRNKTTLAVVYVQDGKPVDATASDAEGDEAIIEILTWREGQFSFKPRVLRNSHTVHQTVDALVSQSKQLSERSHFLKNAGMVETSVFLPKRANLSEAEFVQKAGQNAPMKIEFMMQFYLALDGTQTVESLLRSLQIGRIQLINLIYHLLSNDLIKISNESLKQKPFSVQPRVIDGAAIQAVMMSLRRIDTGMFIYPAFLYFLEQEYFRCYRSRSPLSVIVFEMRMDGGNGQRQMLPGSAILDAVLRISQLKRHVDLLAHYDTYDYAMLLPNTKANGSQIFANRLVRALTSAPLGGEVAPSKLMLSMGCASIPEDFVDLSSLLGAADLAMDQARQQKKNVVLFRDIKPVTV